MVRGTCRPSCGVVNVATCETESALDTVEADGGEATVLLGENLDFSDKLVKDGFSPTALLLYWNLTWRGNQG